jgi:cell division ATPase FtsA
MTGGGAKMRNIVHLAEKTLGVKVRQGYPLKIDGGEDFADGPGYVTAMGLLLWPLYAMDHIHMQRSGSGGFKDFFNRIRHTIEDLF